ncbi:MAG: CRISPR-associated endonuclease Cas1 [Candidatus Bathyarchaeota archaeon]|nr:CRISPR-associated endonuclease Cas1 [Candidatus Bathyarchaeota archaeon]
MKIFLDDFGVFLGRKRNRFLIKKKKEKAEIVADDVDLIIFASQGISTSTSALNLAVKHGIQVVFARYGGWPYAVLMPTKMTGSVKARREQFLAYNDERGFILAKKFVTGKLINQANLLKLIAKNRKNVNPSLAEKIFKAGRLIDDVILKVNMEKGGLIDYKRQTLMNLEAEGARIYWEAVRQVLPEEFCFLGRETRGAKDPFNIMLNFGYQTILFPEVWKAVSYAGLDMYAGYLHTDRPGKPSLVLDLMEEFRQQVVDRTVIGLITKNMVKPGEVFVENKKEKRLSREVVKKLLESFQNRLDTPVMFDGRKALIKSFIYSQAREVVRFLLHEKDYTPFNLGW